MTTHLRLSFFALLILLMLGKSTGTRAQLPDCSSDSSLVYSLSGRVVLGALYVAEHIYNWNPYLPLSATNPSLNTIVPDSSFIGLAVSENINVTTGPSPTFYAVENNTAKLYYHDGTNWVYTGHTAGASAINIGAGGGYIYGLDGATGNIYRYDGTANATFLTTVTDFNASGPIDLVADCEGNFYIMKCGNPGWLRKYTAAGVLAYQWNVTGAPAVGVGFGLAINGNLLMLYTDKLYLGTINPAATSITVSAVTGNFPASFDFGSCQVGGIIKPANDTVFVCKPGTAVPLKAKGIAPYSYTVVSGTATVTGSGPVFQVIDTGMATVVLHSWKNPLYCGVGAVHDTFRVVPAPLVNAGPDRTVYACSNTDTFTLYGQLTRTQPWINYTIAWSPVTAIFSGANTLNPVIQPPTGTTTFGLTVTTAANRGGCTLSDSATILALDESVNPRFTFRLRPACREDTVYFAGTVTAGAASTWSFGDGHTDSVINPVHVFRPQDLYSVKLVARNDHCVDSVIKPVDTRHPLIAAFRLTEDTLCQDSLATFVNHAVVSLQPGTFYWDFGDGATSTLPAPTHRYRAGGAYRVMLVAKDSLACLDTAYVMVKVDPTPYLDILADQHVLCTGEELRWAVRNAGEGNTGLAWDFGDQNNMAGPRQIVHAYDQAGKYYIRLEATYRACGGLSWQDSVIVYDPPVVYIGADTAMCPQGNALLLANTIPANAGDRYLWSTGDTTAALHVPAPGHYNLKVTNSAGCTTIDDIEVRKDCYTDLPNAFTPDGDGVNDYFFPRQLLARGVAAFKMQVFNRWGQQVFQTMNTNGRGWDGRFNGILQPAGVYMYLVEVAFNNGSTEQYEGNVTLL